MGNRVLDHVRRHGYGMLALFLVLAGGTAYAVDGPNPGQNTIGSEDIIGNEVKSDDIGNGRIFNLDIANNIIQSGKIQDGTLGAADLSAGLTSSLKDSCPPTMSNVIGLAPLCISNLAGGPGQWSAAVVNCANQGLRLPSVDELYLAYTRDKLASGAEYWTNSVYGSLGGGVSQAVLVDGTSGAGIVRATSFDEAYHACVTTASDG